MCICTGFKKNIFVYTENMFFYFHNISTQKACKQQLFSTKFKPPIIILPPQKNRVSTTASSLGFEASTAMLPTTNQQAAALGRDGAARFVKLQKVTQKMAGLGRNVGGVPALPRYKALHLG